MRSRRWPWVVAAITVAVFILGNVLYASTDVDVLWTGVFSLIVLAFVFVGALLTARVPGNLVGPVILASGACLATTIAVGTLGVLAAQRRDVPIEVAALLAIVNDVGFQVPLIVIPIGIPLIFPDGRLLSPRWRVIVILAAAALVTVAFTAFVGPGPLGAAEIENPFYVPDLRPLSGLTDEVRAFVLGQAVATRFLQYLEEFLGFAIPAYISEGKTRLTIGIGCTGGYHRSIVITEELASWLRNQDFGPVAVFHRELDRT